MGKFLQIWSECSLHQSALTGTFKGERQCLFLKLRLKSSRVKFASHTLALFSLSIKRFCSLTLFEAVLNTIFMREKTRGNPHVVTSLQYTARNPYVITHEIHTVGSPAVSVSDPPTRKSFDLFLWAWTPPLDSFQTKLTTISPPPPQWQVQAIHSNYPYCKFPHWFSILAAFSIFFVCVDCYVLFPNRFSVK